MPKLIFRPISQKLFSMHLYNTTSLSGCHLMVGASNFIVQQALTKLNDNLGVEEGDSQPLCSEMQQNGTKSCVRKCNRIAPKSCV